jgi:hypothetical protein
MACFTQSGIGTVRIWPPLRLHTVEFFDVSVAGDAFGCAGYREGVKEYAGQLGIAKLAPHDLRRSRVTWQDLTLPITGLPGPSKLAYVSDAGLSPRRT